MKKNNITALFLALSIALTLCACGSKSTDGTTAKTTAKNTTTAATETSSTKTAASSKEDVEMSISSSAITNGTLADEYGSRGSQKSGSIPTRSVPLSIKNAPDGTKTFALVMTDPDSVPVCGYTWVHWLACNITDPEIAANASIDNASGMVQGKNSNGTSRYAGPTPPNGTHTYVFTVYALDTVLSLSEGYSQSALEAAMNGHILAQSVIKGAY